MVDSSIRKLVKQLYIGFSLFFHQQPI